MHEKPRTLRDYWSIGDRPAISLEEIRAIVDARELAPERSRNISWTVVRRWTPLLAATLLATAIVLVLSGPATEQTVGTQSGSSDDRGAAPEHGASAHAAEPAHEAVAAPDRLATQPAAIPHTSSVRVQRAASSHPTRISAPADSGHDASRTQRPPAAPHVPLPDDGRAIELSTDELARIGVQVTESGVVQYYHQYLTNYPMRKTIPSEEPAEHPVKVWSTDARVGQVLRADVGIDTVETFIRMDVDPNARVSYPTFSPELVTSATGKFLPMYYRFDLMMSGKGSMSDSDMAAMSDRMNASSVAQLGDPARNRRLIPVHVRGAGRDIILWYGAHARFLASLPRPVQSQLREELAARPPYDGTDQQSQWNRDWTAGRLHDLDSLLAIGGSSEVDAVARHETGSCYLAACATASGALEMIGIEPNVVQTDGQVRLHIDTPRSLTFALHSFDGKLLRILAADVAASRGELRQHVRFDGVEAGMYFVVVTSDAGERVSSRLLVR